MKPSLHGFRTFAVFVVVWLCAWAVVQVRHRNVPLHDDWRTFLWADQSGYYVYLPAFFIYDFDAARFPANIAKGTGYGFTLDNVSHKVLTKYPVGVALMQSPFFLAAHAYAVCIEGKGNGFSRAYVDAVQAAGITWGCLGLFWLFGFLRRRFGARVSVFTLLLIWLGSPLLYYHSENAGMAHIYAFTLFAGILNFLDRKDILTWRDLIGLGMCAGLVFMVRPTGMLGLVWILIFFIFEKPALVRNVGLHPVKMLVVLIAALLTLIPQMSYWKYASNSWLSYSYGNESFTHLLSPEILKFWFSPNNGLFLYGPIWGVILWAIFTQVFKRDRVAILTLVLFLGTSYLFSSWHIWSFGCGFGSRNHVDYVVFGAVPLAVWMQEIVKHKNRFRQIIVSLLLACCVLISLKLFSSYTKCFFGKNDWDWKEYFYLLSRHTVYPDITQSVDIQKTQDGLSLYSCRQSDLTPLYFREAVISLDWESEDCRDMRLVLRSLHGGGDDYYAENDICQNRGFSEFRFGMWPQISDSTEWHVYLLNPGQSAGKIRNLKIRFR